MRAALSGAREFTGCVAAIIVSPSPVATELAEEAADEATDEADEADDAIKLSYLAREIEPKYPAPEKLRSAACHAATAVLVTEPKYPVAPPEKMSGPVVK